jgi:hypothetical protein
MTPESHAAAQALTQALGVAYRDWQLAWGEDDPQAVLNGLLYGVADILAWVYGRHPPPGGAMVGIDEFLAKLRQDLAHREL